MTDVFTEMPDCPWCGGPMMFNLHGLYCPECDYLFAAEEGEPLHEAAARLSESRDQIVGEMEELR